MCGFAGEIVFDGSAPSISETLNATEVLQPRGPDGRGFVSHGRMAFGHRRLKIIDLSDQAQQPMTDNELGLTIAFNGCIYNYPELRKELKAKGYRFFSTGDTEVILKAYHAWGKDCVKRFHGMFAFAIYERDTGRTMLARDRLGIKPLYLSERRGALRFASSLPALLATADVDTSIDPVALNMYMNFHAVVPAPYTLLKGIRKLPPATVRVVEPDGRTKDEVYWEFHLQKTEADEAKSYEDWQDEVLAALRTAVRRRMVADVPVGVLLSGGLDSSLIVGLLAEEGQTGLNTFSIGFEAAGGESGDEFKYSDIVADHFNTHHHKIFIESKRLLETLPKTFAAMSEPMVSYDNVGFFLLSQKVSEHLKVVQSGQGADEVFGGYHWYPPLADSNDPVQSYERVFRDRDHDEYKRLIHPDLVGADHAHDFIHDHFSRPGANHGVDKALRLDSTVMLVDDPVKRVDNMTMAWGLEARVPFLDHELLELSGRIPFRHKLASGGKGVLKDAARRVIPSDVIDRPKGYFPVPALKYIEGPYLDFVHGYLDNTKARTRGLFQRDYIDLLLESPKDHITPLRGSKLWQVAMLEMWLQTHGI